MLVGGNLVQIDVIIVKKLEIAGLHILAGCEVDGERLFHGMRSFKTGKWERWVLLRLFAYGDSIPQYLQCLQQIKPWT